MPSLFQKRTAAHEEEGALAATVRAAMGIWDAQKVDGVPLLERIAGLAKSLRAAWPKGRDESWRDYCLECRDYGVQLHACPGDRTCGRRLLHASHDYVTPCWCEKGKRYRPPAPAAPEDYTAAVKPKRAPVRSGFQRVGR